MKAGQSLKTIAQILSRQIQAYKSKKPSANAGVFQFQMVARGGI
jgi:hypothetical protein